jgi:hypothetical protein
MIASRWIAARSSRTAGRRDHAVGLGRLDRIETWLLRPTQRPLTSFTRSRRRALGVWLDGDVDAVAVVGGRIVKSDDCQLTSIASGSTL